MPTDADPPVASSAHITEFSGERLAEDADARRSYFECAPTAS
jgi:hypothetical protein